MRPSIRDLLNIIREADQGDPDAEHFDALRKTGFFGKAGAGCIFLAKDTNRILLAHRSKYVEQPGDFGNFGGAINSGENPEEAVKREVYEEAGYIGKFVLVPLLIYTNGSFKYYNYVAVVRSEFTPKLDWENQGFLWCEWGKWPPNLHFGMRSLFSDNTSVNTIKKIMEK
jgi:8-oxo-dGTP pyrophosphatase MutT (NUDIX family)